MSIPQSRLGQTTGLSNITGREVFCVMKTYFDGSYGKDERGDAWITFAGIAGTDELWAKFDHEWSKMLKSRYPVAPYIHMIELLGHEDPFEDQVGWCYENKRQLIQDAVVLLSQMNKAHFIMGWSSIPESLRLRLQKEGKPVPEDPYLHLASDCMYLMVGQYLLHAPGDSQEPIYVFFDRGEPFLGTFKNNWLKYRTPPRRTRNPKNWFDSFADVQDVDLPYHFGLQVADMIAWAHSRSLREEERPYWWLKEWLIKCVPSSRLEYDETKLLLSCEYRKGWETVFTRDI